MTRYVPGDRVLLLPDAFKRDDTQGTVTRVGHKWIHVRADSSGRTLRLTPNDIKEA